MTERTGPEAATAVVGERATMNFGDSWENDDGSGGRTAADKSGQGIVTAFGQSLKTLRVRAGMEREELGRRLGYSASSIASFEQGRRIPSPRAIEQADEVLGAEGLLTVWMEQMERAQYPVFFQGMAKLEKEAVELLVYDTHVLNGLLQTEEYMRAVLAMRRPVLDQETIEQRVTARLTRQNIFNRWPAPLLSFVLEESALRHPWGGTSVHRGQLEQLLLIGEKQNVEIQVMPTEREYNAGVDGAFTVIARKDGKRFVYTEAQGASALQTEPEQTTLAAARYGIIRSQALPSRESLDFMERLLGSL
ncbi:MULTISPECIES: helix-turn-helix transcriptional regulator [unclassified Streptomyces]|uniref:helix-turn-helix domain-containing protein n=1 Tax=unclassified Streptomyces TaxID=2593676 RepID=UPI0001C1A73A|nr:MULTISPECIES: helix-turn-helix transcriptional regulator [unclassified Streptomyces]MYR66112.1 helix-turn-helix domain-containing protein [Streptomyces sp. SID4939]MYS00953.1 helix-turn-helix domain-containing protein [Streptomyces sp. SID4940]MYT65761.1 helix-turn-helix domain-containing protein [Streptomyces sp. SID8357]MYT84203.1 helix-turn-helix domain-containing protein [Streptomyces sp. SID8360]MYU36155.1 helix-turn-helix domain-containing protein [Streptomyces sp. SID8358]MYW40343.1